MIRGRILKDAGNKSETRGMRDKERKDGFIEGGGRTGINAIMKH
jgi:hypothetical protein